MDLELSPQSETQQDNAPEQPTPAPVVETPAPEAPAAPTGLDKLREQAKAGVAPSLPEKPASLATPEAQAALAEYKANLKFKAHGKEYEVPEILRGVMKDAKAEKYVHDLLEKSYGLGPIKDRFEQTRTQLKEVTGQHQQVMGMIQEAQTAYRSGDLDSMFETFKISPEKVLQWAVKQVELMQMPPEQRQLVQQQREAVQRNKILEKQYQERDAEAQQIQSQNLEVMLNMVLERPDISAVAQAYNQRKGSEDAFRGLVVQMGQMEYAQSGKILSPLEAANRASELLGSVAPPAPAPQVQEPVAAPAPQATPAAPKKTLPNLANAGAKSGTAPARAPMKSLDDIKKRYDEIARKS